MRFVFLLFITVGSFFKVFSQFQDTYQSSSLYKANHVKARILMFDYNKHNTKMIDLFDQNGFVTEHIQFDTTGLKVLSKSKLKYDSMQKLVSETIYNYLYHYDSITHTMNLVNVADTLVSKIEYDSNNRVTKKVLRNSAGKKVFEVRFTFDPNTQIERHYSIIDSNYLEMNIIYETGCIEKKTTYSHLYNGELDTWVYTYKNHFDQSGKIKSRSVTREGDPPEIAKYLNLYFGSEEFQYMKNGLLLNKTSRDLNDDTGRISRQIFDYKFW